VILIRKLVEVIKKDIKNNPEKWKQEKYTLEHVDNKTVIWTSNGFLHLGINEFEEIKFNFLKNYIYILL
jgi:hypothetical protein